MEHVSSIVQRVVAHIMTKRGRRTMSEPVEFEGCSCEVESTSAILVEIPEHGELWIPKSQVHDDSEVYKKGTEGKLVITAWLATQKGLV